MKTLTLIAIGLFYSISSFASNEVPIDSIQNYIGKSVTVCSKVYGIKAFEKVTLLNVGAKFPESPLTIAIMEKDKANFPFSVDSMYNGKSICVTGTVQLFKGKAEIVVSKPGEIVIKDEPEANR